jgi:hypothetical protein
LVKTRLHTKNQLPRLSRTALIVMIPGGVVVVWWFFLPIIIPPQQKLSKVVLGCWLGCGNKLIMLIVIPICLINVEPVLR